MMDFSRGAFTGEVSLWFARWMTILANNGDMSGMGVEVAAITKTNTSQGAIAESTSYPRAYWVHSPKVNIMLFAGANTIDHARLLANAYTAAIPRGSFVEGVPEYLGQGAFSRLGIFNSQGNADEWWMVGHSLGGAIALAALANLSTRGRIGRLHGLTFGSPRTGDQRFVARLRTLDVARWATPSDPVPLLPPSIETAPAMFLASAIRGVTQWPVYRHAEGGMIIYPDGTSSIGVLPPQGVISNTSDMAAWLLAIQQQQQSAHSMTTYLSRLQQNEILNNPPQSIPNRTADVEPSRTTSRRSSNEQEQAAIDTIVRTGAIQNSSPLRVPDTRAFKTVKIGRLWWVLFGEYPIACGPTRKRAGLMANTGNRFLRRLQRMAGVDTLSLETILHDYLEAASTPENGFTPPIAAFG